MKFSRSHRLEQQGLKRKQEEPDKPPNYTVFAYVPDLCDALLLDPKNKSELPNVQCRECLTWFEQKSITDYKSRDEYEYTNVDLQFHQFGGLCLWCRAPFAGEGHFEAHDVHPLRYVLPEVLGGVSALEVIVWEYYYREHELPAYTPLDPKHYCLLRCADLIDLYKFGLQYMTVPGVEHVYRRVAQIGKEGAPDIKLDYRFWRPKQCKCTKTPCECICYGAQIRNITQKLQYTNAGDYKVMGIQSGTTGVMQMHDFVKENYQTFFVYLRDWSAQNPDHDTDGSMFQQFPAGVCRTVHIESRYGKHDVVTEHAPECQRRNAPYKLYKCMLNEGLCGRCADCSGY
jgi:hypothetical protein